MSWCRRLAFLVSACHLLAPVALADKGNYVLGGGAEFDSAQNRAFSVLGDFATGQKTWLTVSIARNLVELGRGLETRTWYADVGMDHYFEPVGIRFGAAYWGDNDILDSIDARFSLYARGDNGTVSVDFDYRNFEFDLPPIDILPRTKIPFHAAGIGVSGRLHVSDRVSLHAGGVRYDYDVDFDNPDTVRIAQQLSISRLSLLSSLIDWNVSAGVGVDFGLKRWQLEASRWRSSLDNGETTSVTLRFLAPVTDRSDIELGLGYDNSELYGDVTFASVFFYFYGGN